MLPIRKVVLYKHGVGYFERQGEVDGAAAVDLHFRASEMNDVLKSLTTLDLTSGRIASISYESTTPLEKQLEDVAIRLSDENAVSGLLAEIKGARLAVEIAGERVEGVVAGVETVRRAVGESVLEVPHVALLVDGKSVRTFDLQEVRGLEFLDEGLRKDLQHLLQVLIDAKRKDRKRLTIFTQGDGKREILAAYVVETPVWKTSYRVLLSEEKPVIQAWALVDNTQDEDWVDVDLSLVAGLPVSFVHDLYSPRYKRRPVVEVREEAAYAPPLLEQAEAALDVDEMETVALSAGFAPPAPAMLRRREKALRQGAEDFLPEARAEARDRSVAVQTRTVEVGDLFSYDISNPVTVKRNQSALVPILQGPFEGKRVAVYSPEVRDRNPLSAVLFRNTTGTTLEGGPLTVLEDETYVGESMLETIKPDEERLLPYSVELGCVVTVDHRSRREDVRHARIANGVLHLRHYRVEETIYVLQNKNDRAIDLFLEHRFRRGWNLVDTPDPTERTGNLYRFRLDVPAKKTTKFTVTERGDEVETFSLADVDRDAVRLWLRKRFVDEGTRQVLDDLIARQEGIAALERRIAGHEQETRELFEDQKRQRENLKALGDSQQERALRERTVKELTAGEDRLKVLRAEMAAWKKERDEQSEELRRRLQEVAFEADL